ncbi:hypothetical protein NW752_001838 [Fusarium irregulare]|uniref:Uncharacterized protein n=1 Tax=Fusarium irregulare TaxID=2494466 RepID=A0A9W8UCI9_9HYPO|nr:hypothetical protein NW766_004003 [Fusarium irregulare]KAJ4026880.1 hypothetical protein NW752_001838 [Fusarium irregulare]
MSKGKEIMTSAPNPKGKGKEVAPPTANGNPESSRGVASASETSQHLLFTFKLTPPSPTFAFDFAATPKGILKSPGDAPSSSDSSRHPTFSFEANTSVTIPANNRGRRPVRGMTKKKNRLYFDSRFDKSWVVVNEPRIEYGVYVTHDDTWDDGVIVYPDEDETCPHGDEEIISQLELMNLSSDDRANLILTEPFEHTCIRLRRHQAGGSDNDSK